jgi:hypothetical protein
MADLVNHPESLINLSHHSTALARKGGEETSWKDKKDEEKDRCKNVLWVCGRLSPNGNKLEGSASRRSHR